MALRKTKLVEGEIYHLYSRGNFKHEIFHDRQDYDRFKKILFLSNGTRRFKYKDLLKYEKNVYKFDRGEPIVSLICYVLMPNHFHLLAICNSIIKSKDKSINQNLDNNISIFMKRVNAAYSMYYNRKYNKVGGLFESKFKSEHVSDNNYFKYLFSYIHLNPIKLIQSNWREEGIKDIQITNNFLNNYQYSSFKDYFLSPGKSGGYRENDEGKIVNKDEFYNRIEAGTDLNKEIFDWLKFETIN